MRKNQSGFVSIIAAAILMILLSLVTLGLFQLMQREQRQSLDRQLSSQAFYAAETAVNDVYEVLDTLPEEKIDCSVDSATTPWNDGIIDAATPEIVYSCLQYDKTPVDLVFTDAINSERSKVFPIEPENSATANVSTVTFRWNGPNGSTVVNPGAANSCPAGTQALPSLFSATAIPMLRIDLIAVPRGQTLKRDSSVVTPGFPIVENTASVYLYPKSCGGASGTFSSYVAPNNLGQIVNVNCGGGSGCSFTMNGLNQNRYYARIRSIYNNVETLNITATTSDGSQFEFRDAQTLVDATGRANDVLRRIEVRLSNEPDYPWPEYVVHGTDGICKTLRYYPNVPNSFVSDSDCYP